MIEASIENFMIVEIILGGLIFIALFFIVGGLDKIWRELQKMNEREETKIPLYKKRSREELEFIAKQAQRKGNK